MWDFLVYSVFHYRKMMVLVNNKILDKIIHTKECSKMISFYLSSRPDRGHIKNFLFY